MESEDETYVVNVAFHHGRAEGEVIRRQHPEDVVPQMKTMGPLRSFEQLYSACPFNVPEDDVVGEIASAIEALELKDAITSVEETREM